MDVLTVIQASMLIHLVSVTASSALPTNTRIKPHRLAVSVVITTARPVPSTLVAEAAMPDRAYLAARAKRRV